MGGKVSKTGNVDTLEYLHAVARATGVPDTRIANIVDEASAWEEISQNLGIWAGGKADPDAASRSAAYAKTLNRDDIALKNQEAFDALVKAVRGNDYDINKVVTARTTNNFKGLDVNIRNSINRARELIDEANQRAALSRQSGGPGLPYLSMPDIKLVNAGFGGVRYARSADDVVDLIKAGEVSKARMAFDDMTFNSMVSVPPSLRNNYLMKQDAPIFYLLSDIRNRWLSSKTGIPLNVIQSLGGVGSHNRGPSPEFIRVIRGTAGIDWDPEAKRFFVSTDASVRRSGRAPRDVDNMRLMAESMNDLIDNTVGGMSAPSRIEKVTGLSQKAKDYSTQSGSALGTKSSVQDLWEHRTPFGDRIFEGETLETPDNIEANLVLQAVSASSARQLGISSLPAAQEMRWANMHHLTEGGIKPSFQPTTANQIQFPQLPSGKSTESITALTKEVESGSITPERQRLLDRLVYEEEVGLPLMTDITRKKNQRMPKESFEDIAAQVAPTSGNQVPLRLQQGMVESIAENPKDWVSVAGTPVPSPVRSFVPAPGSEEFAAANEFADWLAGYSDQSRELSRVEALNRIYSQKRRSQRPSAFRSASPYIGASIPPSLFGLYLLGQEESPQ